MKLQTKIKCKVRFCSLVALGLLIVIFCKLDLFARYNTFIYSDDKGIFEITIPKGLIKHSLFDKRKYKNDDEIIISADSNCFMKIDIVKNASIRINDTFKDSVYFQYLYFDNEISTVKMYYHYYSAFSEYFTSGIAYSYGIENNNPLIIKNKFKIRALKAVRFNKIEFRFQFISDKNIEVLCEIDKKVKFVESIKVKKIK